ncbi:PKD domain-containing protein [Holdemania massiliensis]|uniref:PKD domain-containing protein n=1 Tax=Holdemania massiliensis TaxID=1468449 RepID=UPI001F069BD9|nr:PKD domain-containing protein [Holdemania massiliensis]MCH1939638.1 PKD domain-containing protein [Holdemania massiliensis]
MKRQIKQGKNQIAKIVKKTSKLVLAFFLAVMQFSEFRILAEEAARISESIYLLVGETKDIASYQEDDVTISVADPSIALLEDSLLTGMTAGETELLLSNEEKQTIIPIIVTEALKEEPTVKPVTTMTPEATIVPTEEPRVTETPELETPKKEDHVEGAIIGNEIAQFSIDLANQSATIVEASKYASTHVMQSTISVGPLNQIPSNTAKIQIINDKNEIIAVSKSSLYSTEANGEHFIETEVYYLTEINPGTYQIQIVDGTEVFDVNQIEFIDNPIIKGLQGNGTIGLSSLEIEIRFDGLLTQDIVSKLKIQVLDANDRLIGSANSDHVTVSGTTLNYVVSTETLTNQSYHVSIIQESETGIYIDPAALNNGVYVSSNYWTEIQSIEILDLDKSVIRLNLNEKEDIESHDYLVEANITGNIVFSDYCKAKEGTIELQLKKKGVESSIQSFIAGTSSPSLMVSLMDNRGFTSSKSLDLKAYLPTASSFYKLDNNQYDEGVSKLNLKVYMSKNYQKLINTSDFRAEISKSTGNTEDDISVIGSISRDKMKIKDEENQYTIEMEIALSEPLYAGENVHYSLQFRPVYLSMGIGIISKSKFSGYMRIGTSTTTDFSKQNNLIPIVVETNNSIENMTVSMEDEDGNVIDSSQLIKIDNPADNYYVHTGGVFLTPNELIGGKTYHFYVILNGNKELVKSYVYNAEKVIDDSLQLEAEKTGTNKVKLYFKAGYTNKNVSEEDILKICSELYLKDASDHIIKLAYKDSAMTYYGDWTINLEASENLKKTTYEIYWRGYPRSIVPGEKAVYGYENEGKIIISNSDPKALYTANILKDGKVVKKGLKLISTGNEKYQLETNFAQGLEAGNYKLNVLENNVFVFQCDYSISQSYDYSIRVNDRGKNWNQTTTFITNPDRIASVIVESSKYIYCRVWLGDKKNVGYRSILLNSSTSIRLDDTKEQQIIHVQLKNDDGIESEVIDIPVYYRPVPGTFELVDVTNPVDVVATGSAIKVSMIGNRFDAQANVLLEGNTSKQCTIPFKEELEDGTYLYEGYVYPGYNQRVEKATFYLTSEDYPYTKSNEITKPLIVGGLSYIVLPLFGTYGGEAYTTAKDTVLEGYALQDKSVDILIKDPDNETTTSQLQTNEKGYFETTLNTEKEGTYILKVTSPGLQSYYSQYKLYSDRTAPVIESAAAVESGSKNIMIKWECNNPDVDYYMVYRDDYLIADKYKERTYITSGTLNDRVTYKIIAVDKAGNHSEPIVKKIGDYEPPTIPENIELADRSSKQIHFTWSASKDNVGVKGYRIYRNDKLVATVDTCVYTDMLLTKDTSYTYVVEAFDAAGNASKSEPVQISTVSPKFQNISALETEYIIEEQEMVAVSAEWKNEQNMIDHLIILKIKEENASDWNIISEDQIGKATVNISKMEAGKYTLAAIAKDRDGETTEELQTFTLKHDDINPTVAITTPLDGTKKIYTHKFSIQGKSEDNVAVDRVRLEYSVGNVKAKLITELKPDVKKQKYDYSYEWDSSEVSGTVTITATAFDSRGNKTSTTSSFVVDNTPPKVPTQFSISNTDQYIYLDWKHEQPEEDFDHFVIYRSDKENEGFEAIDTITTLGFYDDINTGAQPNVKYYYYVTSVDILGNESKPTAILQGIMERDVQNPEVVSVLPKENSILTKTVTLSVSVYDNASLDTLTAEYFDIVSNSWQLIERVTIENKKSSVEKILWNTEGLSGNIQIRYIVTDKTGNVSNVKEVTYDVVEYTAPEKPILSVQVEGAQANLSWTYSGEDKLLKNFRVWIKEENSEWKSLGYTQETEKTVNNHDGRCSFKIEAIDNLGASADSNMVDVLLITPDTEAPVAHINLQKVTIKPDEEINFDASKSKDDRGIVSYSWNMGNDENVGQESFTYTYSTPGTYTVTLTVKDEAGNIGTATCEVTVVEDDSKYVQFDLSVINRRDNTSIGNVAVKFSKLNGDEVLSFITDDQGKANVIIESGSYLVELFANGYFSEQQKVMVDSTLNDIAFKLSKLDFIEGKLTSTEMTYDEIVAAGIDVNDPDNQHIYKHEVKLEFAAGLEIPVTVYKNSAGKILRAIDGIPGFFKNSFTGIDSSTNSRITIYPISEKFYLAVIGEAKWLKQMFDVRLVVLNTSDSLDIENCRAKLEIPEGLSFPDMGSKVHYEEHDLGKIENTLSATTNWYIRGDQAGEYTIKAKVEAEIDNESFEIEYETEDPIRVLDPSKSLKMHITAPDAAYYGEEYTFTISLENISEKPIYGLSYVIQSLEQYKVIQIGDKETKLPITQEDFDPETCGIEVDELEPGDTVSFTISTKVLFNSILEIAKKIPSMLDKIPTVEAQSTSIMGKVMDVINVRYFLTNIFVTKLEGSTTDIDYDVTIDHVRFPSVWEVFAQEYIDVAKKELSELFGGAEFNEFVSDQVFAFLQKPIVELEEEIKEKGYIELEKHEIVKNLESIFKVINPTPNTKVVITVEEKKRSGSDALQIRCVEGQAQTTELTNRLEIIGNGRFAIVGQHSGEATVRVSFEDGKAYTIPVKVIGEEDTIANQTNAEVVINGDKSEISNLDQLLEDAKNSEDQIKAENPLYPVQTVLCVDLTEKDVFKLSIPIENLEKIYEAGAQLTLITKAGKLSFNRKVLEEIQQIQGNEFIFGIVEVNEEKPESYSSTPIYKVLMQYDDQELNLEKAKIVAEVPFTVDLNKINLHVVSTDYLQNYDLDYVYNGTMVQFELNQPQLIGFILEPKKQENSNDDVTDNTDTPVVSEAAQSQDSATKKTVVINKVDNQNQDLLQQTWDEVLDNLTKDEKREIRLNAAIESIPAEVIKAISESDNTLVITLPDGTQVKIDSELAKQLDLDGKSEISIKELLAQKNEIIENDQEMKEKQSVHESEKNENIEVHGKKQESPVIIWLLIIILLAAAGYFIYKKIK